MHFQKKDLIKVVLLFGGKSAEHDISCSSASSIYDGFDKNKFEIISVYINPQGLWRIVESPHFSKKELNKGTFFSFLPWNLQKKGSPIEADIYFPVLHGRFGEDGSIQGLFEMAGVPYVGAGVFASSLCMDKASTKKMFDAHKLPTVKHLALNKWDWGKNKKNLLHQIKHQFQPPVFIKPSRQGSSIGISKVIDLNNLTSAVNIALKYDNKILVEQGISGRELECGVLGNEEPLVSHPGEIIPFREFYDFKDKYLEGKTQFKIPAPLTKNQIKEIKLLALNAFQVLNCSGMARVDFFLEEKTEKIYLNEVNTIPGFTSISMYPKLWKADGLSFQKLLTTLIKLGFSRHKGVTNKEVPFKK